MWQSALSVDTSVKGVKPLSASSTSSTSRHMGLSVSCDSGEMAQGRTGVLISHNLEKRMDSEVSMLAIDSKLLRVIKMEVDCTDLQKTLTMVRSETIEEQTRLI